MKRFRRKWDVLIILISLSVSVFIYCQIKVNLWEFDAKSTLSDILTINVIFSTILITYLFARITWTKERKLELYKSALDYSEKVTCFRKILEVFTSYYDLWENEQSTKTLLDHGEYGHIDFYDLRMGILRVKKPKGYKIIRELYHDQYFEEGISTIYLAMLSLVSDRKNERSALNMQYKDFLNNDVYELAVIERWLDSSIMGSGIWYWLTSNTHYIKYQNLSRDNKSIISSAATKIDSKYGEYEIGNKLIREIANDMENIYLPNLYRNLKQIEVGIKGLNLLITVLVLCSLFFGVLLPFLLLLVASNDDYYLFLVVITTAFNTGLIAYFILKLPFLITRELKFPTFLN